MSCCQSSPSSSRPGLENTAVLDAFAHDTERDILILAMFELRPWDLGELQLFQLQEKINAYLSFLLDGELEESFPHLKEKPVRIELRTLQEPSNEALGFIERVQEQIAHQNISFEVVLIEEQFEGCGSDCSCNEPMEAGGCCQEKEATSPTHGGCCCS